MSKVRYRGQDGKVVEVDATPSVTIHRDSVPSFHVVAVPSRDDAVPGVYYGTWGAPDFLVRTFTAFEQHYRADTLVLAVDAADRLGAPLFFRGPRRHPDVPASGHLRDVPRSAVVPGERQWFSVCYEDGTARVVGFRRSQVVETAEFVARTRHDGHMQSHGYGPLAEAEARQRASRQAEWWTQLGGPGAKRQREEAQAELDAVCEAWEERTLDAALSTYVCARSSRRLRDAWLLWRDSARGRRLRLELMGRARCHRLSAAFAAWCMAVEIPRAQPLPSAEPPMEPRADLAAEVPSAATPWPVLAQNAGTEEMATEIATGEVAAAGKVLSPPLALPPRKFLKSLPPIQPPPSPRPPTAATPTHPPPPQPPACSPFSLMGLCIPPGLIDDTMREAVISPRFADFSLPPPSQPAPPVSSCHARAGAVGARADPTILSSNDSAASSENEAFAATTPSVRHWVGGGNGRQFWRGASPPAQSPLRARANTSLLLCRPHTEMPSTAAGAEHATLLPLYRGDNPFTSC